MITMKRLGFILAPALLVALVSAELKIMPAGVQDRPEGTMFSLTCIASADDEGVSLPPPSQLGMKWLFKNVEQQSGGSKMLQFTNTGLSLIFTSLQLRDAGEYRCTAQINGVLQEAATVLKVKEKITFLSDPVQPVINGTDAKVRCRTKGNMQNRTIVWYQKDGESFTSIASLDAEKFIPSFEASGPEQGPYLLIRKVTLADSMTYTCSLWHTYEGTAINFDIQVIVTVPPKFMPIYLDPTSPKEGDKLTITCQADGVPPPTYMLYRNSRALTDTRRTEGKYVIESLNRYDEGTYVCNAMNSGGSQNESVFLDVKIPPTFQDTDNISMNEGQRVELPCISLGDPVPSMSFRKKGSQVYFLSEAMSDGDMYVEEAEDIPPHPSSYKIYRRTLTLVIPELKPKHAGEYVCRADNQYGVKDRTFKIDVLYKPNFDSQKQSVFYGWLGSRTNLTCIADGNPEPMFTWLKDGQQLRDGDLNYEISRADGGIPTRAIGYLKPKVAPENVDTVFGEYTCKAMNKYGNSQQTLVFQRAEVPDMATVNLYETKPTEMTLRISPPTNNGGQPVFKYVVKYGPSDSPENLLMRNFSRYANEESTQVTLDNLTPKTPYTIRVYAVNNVGLGTERRIVEATKDFSRPDPVEVLSLREGVSGHSFDLSWKVRMTGGLPITNYIVEYTEALKVDASGDVWKVVREAPEGQRQTVDGEENTRLTLTGLKEETYYKAKIFAANRMGTSDAMVFVFRTGRGGEEMTDDGKDEPALGAGGIVGLMIVVLLLVAVAVDAAFYKTKQCGLIWTLSRMMGRKEEGTQGVSKTPEDGDEAATKLLAKEKDELRTENEVDKDAPDAGTKAAEEDTEGQVTEEKKELEPEDKEEKPADVVTADPAATSTEADPPPKEPAGEATTQVETKPPAEKKDDQPPKA